MIKSSWKGSANPSTLTGIARFEIDKTSYYFELHCFDDFSRMDKMVSDARLSGQLEMALKVRREISDLAEQITLSI